MDAEDEKPLDPQDEAVAEALVAQVGAPSMPPPWLERLEERLLVGVLGGGTPPDSVRAVACAHEKVGGDRWVFALRANEAADTTTTVQEIRRWAKESAGTAALAIDHGVVEERAVFGPAVEAAGQLFRAATGPGVWVDAEVYHLTGGPAEQLGDGFRLPSIKRRPAPAFIAGFCIAATVTLALALPSFRPTEPTLHAAVFLSVQPHTRGTIDGVRANDVVHIVLEGSPGAFGTLLLLDSSDQVSAPAPELVGAPFTERARHRRASLTLDDQPGQEGFLALSTRAPPSQELLERLLRQANEPQGRAPRLVRLRAALEAELGADGFSLAAADEIRHVE